MTFRFLTPWLAWLLIATAAVAAGVLFALRPRPPRRVVSSLLVWQRVLDSAPAHAWRDRVRWLLSLMLTTAVAAVLAAAFARPAPAAGESSGRRLIVLDSSWTMGATTPRGTRWSDAIERARQLADAWHGDLAIATTADGVIEGPTPDKALVLRALSRLQPTGADGAWPQVSGASDVHFLTDGALARPLPPDVIVHSVFTPAPNVAISAFEVEPAPGTSGEASVFLAVANHAETAQVVRIGISRAADALVDTTVQLEAGAVHREVLTVGTPGAPRFHAHLSAPENNLAIDDDAAAWLWAAEPLRVTVVGTTASPLAALLARDPSLIVASIDPAAYPRATADVWIFDGWTPPEPPARPALLIDPPPARWLGPRGPDELRPTWSRAAAHPLLEGVDAALLEIDRARAIIAPLFQPIAVSTQGTSLLAIEERGTSRRVALAFSLGESNLSATPAFPVLVGNILDWLGRPERDLDRQAGPLVLPANTARVVAPDGRSLPLARFDDRVTANLDQPGLYLVQSPGGQSVVRVTISDTRRSNLLVSSIGAAPAIPDVTERGSRPWWVALAAAAFALAALEWVTWQQRITI